MSTSMRASRFRPRLVVAAAAASVTIVGSCCYAHRRHDTTSVERRELRIQLPSTAVEAIAGAAGEVAQILALYPLDTIKVRCQAMGMSSAHVIRDLCSHGINIALLKQLYAGALGAALCSIAIGAVHYASFESSRRLILQRMAPASTRPSLQTAGHAAEVAVPTAQGKGLANVLAAAFAAFMTAVVESPVELFRHNQQAGLVKGDFMRQMVTAVRREGPAGLYWGFLPHCFEAWPHDISELLVIGGMKDLHEDSLHPMSAHHWWTQAVPLHAWDLTTGAAAGGAAVLISMPFDCIKTYMQTHGTDLSGRGIYGGAKLYLRTAMKMVTKGGPGALYYGVVPRLLQQVPSSMLCWYVIHAVQRLLLPYTTPHGPAPVSAEAVPSKVAPLTS